MIIRFIDCSLVTPRHYYRTIPILYYCSGPQLSGPQLSPDTDIKSETVKETLCYDVNNYGTVCNTVGGFGATTAQMALNIY